MIIKNFGVKVGVQKGTLRFRTKLTIDVLDHLIYVFIHCYNSLQLLVYVMKACLFHNAYFVYVLKPL